ncbi:cell cycle checkpoint protein RAD17 isoform X4 [Thunnus thynnus]|uniref:cell cycle checkpoint protein RAD17 isoform X4 n=1 Tax=Thunnus thynnus TaxID=8237 RepID=UPI0035271AAE
MSKLSLGDKAASSKVSRWVDPSFTDLPGERFSLSGRMKGSQVLCSKAEPKRPRKRKGETGSSDPHASHLLKESAQRDQDEPWVHRYLPYSKAELAVHKKKVEEVENWMRLHTNTLKGGILLLTGPSGCGKTATVQVLCRELGLRVQEWTNPTSLEPYTSSQHVWRMNGLSCTSQLAQFQEFLLRANKYNCLKMVGDGGVTDIKLILVEDFPNQFYRQPGSLHDVLRRFVKTSRCPLVFIVSDSLSGDSSSRFLFPRDILEELDISSISFNPVAPTTMMKVLTRISTLEAGKQSCGRICVPDQAVLEMLCSGSSGDIRSAINSLQFSSLPDTPLEKGLCRVMKDRPVASLGKAVYRTNQTKNKSTQAKEREEGQAIGGKDASLFLFRALGKILHCKRGNPEGAEGAEGAGGPGLPSHLSQHYREALLIDPELVVERSHMSGEFFNLYLHQNYLDFFSEVEDVDKASEYLSDADLLTADWMKHGGATLRLLWKGTHSLCRYKGLILRVAAPWGIMDPQWPPGGSFTPTLNKLLLASDLCTNLTGCWSTRRLKLEALTDKEHGQLELDSMEEDEKEEGQGGGEKGLPASQPQPTTSQILLEEEDLMIVEYNSD